MEQIISYNFSVLFCYDRRSIFERIMSFLERKDCSKIVGVCSWIFAHYKLQEGITLLCGKIESMKLLSSTHIEQLMHYANPNSFGPPRCVEVSNERESRAINTRIEVACCESSLECLFHPLHALNLKASLKSLMLKDITIFNDLGTKLAIFKCLKHICLFGCEGKTSDLYKFIRTCMDRGIHFTSTYFFNHNVRHLMAEIVFIPAIHSPIKSDCRPSVFTIGGVAPPNMTSLTMSWEDACACCRVHTRNKIRFLDFDFTLFPFNRHLCLTGVPYGAKWGMILPVGDVFYLEIIGEGLIFSQVLEILLVREHMSPVVVEWVPIYAQSLIIEEKPLDL